MLTLDQYYNEEYNRHFSQYETKISEDNDLLLAKYEEYNVKLSELYDEVAKLKDKFIKDSEPLMIEITGLISLIKSNVEYLDLSWADCKKELLLVYTLHHYFTMNLFTTISLKKLAKQLNKAYTYAEIKEIYNKYYYTLVDEYQDIHKLTGEHWWVNQEKFFVE